MVSEQLPEDAILSELNALARAGHLTGDTLNGALQSVLSDPQVPAPLALAVSSLLRAILVSVEQETQAGQVMKAIAGVLGKRYDSESLWVAVDLYAQARACFAPGSPDHGGTQMNEATARLRLAELGEQAVENLRVAIALYAEARACLAPGSPDHGLTQMNEANAWCRLAELGEQAVENLRLAIALYAQARACFAPGSPDHGGTQMNEANARRSLAQLGEQAVENLRLAIALYAEARACFAPGSPSHGSTQMNEATARLSLAELGEQAVENLRLAIALYAEARACFAPGSPDHGRNQLNEATARLSLAQLGEQAVENLRLAEDLYRAALPSLIDGSLDQARTWHNLARLLRSQGRLAEAQAELSHALQVLEHSGSTAGTETERRAFRESFESTYRLMVAVCLQRAADEPNLEQAEALRWEAWQWAQRAKARTLQESMALNETEAEAVDPALIGHLEQVMQGLLQLEHQLGEDAATDEREGGAATLGTAHQQLDGLVAELAAQRPATPAPYAPPTRAHLEAALDIFGQERPVIAVEFFPQESGAIGAFVRAPGEALQVMTELPGGHRRMVEVANTIRLASHLISAGARGLRVRDGRALAVNERWLMAALSLLSESTAEKPFENYLDTSRASLQALAALVNDAVQVQPETEEGNLGVQMNATQLAAFADAAAQQGTHLLEDAAAALGEFFTPVREAILGMNAPNATLLLCPTGPMHLLPLAAAHWNDGSVPGCDGVRRLIDAHPLQLLPTAALVPEVRRRHEEARRANAGHPPQAYLAAADRTGRLAAIYTEIADCAEQLQGHGFTAPTVQREQAVTQSFYDASTGSAVVHLAMHSGMHRERFDLCGVEFHNRRLTVLELLLRVRMKKALLAFVAACNSAEAQNWTADDPSAISRAWMLAGAATVIGGLWPLADEAAAEFSKAFYRNWLNGISMAESARAAMQDLRQQDRSLYEWAPFVVVGGGAGWSTPN